MSRQGLFAALALLAALQLAGCATPGAPGSADRAGTAAAAGEHPAPTAGAAAPHPGDPWERFNRRVYAFNDTLDRLALKPVAQAYQRYVPSLVRTGVGNVLGNLGDIWSTANHLLQGKGEHGVAMGMRVLTNSFFGLGGLLDFATPLGMPRRSEDFGQTLGRWGVGSGPYVVLPLFGPRTLRDAGALMLDQQASASSFVQPMSAQAAVSALGLIDLRASLLSTTALLNQVAIDPYSFTRDAYLARRLDQVWDGAAPLQDLDPEDFADDAPADALPPASAPAARGR